MVNVSVKPSRIRIGRYTNGQSQMFGQVVLAEIPDTRYLQRTACNAWITNELT